MSRPPLVILIFDALLSSFISFAMPWISVLTVGRLRLAITAAIAVLAFMITLAIAVMATLVHRSRGLWAVLAAVPALFWPALEISFMVACALGDESCAD